MGTIKTTNIETITGSGTLTLGQSGETITIPSGVTLTNNGTASGFGTNTPAFAVKMSGNQGLSNATATKVAFDTEIKDTDNCYDTGTYRFTPTTAGTYYFYFVANGGNDGASTLDDFEVKIRKNGTDIINTDWNHANNQPANSHGTAIAIEDMNGSTDYVEFFIIITTSVGSPDLFGFNNTRAGGFKIIT